MEKFDIVVIGGGLGGLVCGALLSLEGKKVCVLEKNKQIGGALQSFGWDKKLFESAVHYVGSLGKGETLFKLFNYLGIIDKLSLQKLDEDCFDEIHIGGKTYKLPQTYERFENQLIEYFPNQACEIRNYINEIKHVCDHFPLYNMKLGDAGLKLHVSKFGLKQKMDTIFSDEKIKQVLTANNLLYAGNYETSPFYIHALIMNSYIESSWKFTEGSTQLGKALQEIILTARGKVIRNTEVVNMEEQEGLITKVKTKDGKTFYANHFISNLHPGITYSLLDSKLIRNVTRKRIEQTQLTSSAFMVNISLRENMVPYINHNSYFHKSENVWHDLTLFNLDEINSFGVFYYQDIQNPHYAKALSILTYMPFQNFEKWHDSFRTTSNFESRNKSYQDFKKQVTEYIINSVSQWLPNLKTSIQAVDACTPLSYRDYLNSPNGSMYGFQKNVNDLANTTYSTRTKISNLFLTGQNINLHGVLGVSITSILTSSEILGLEYLVGKINNSNYTSSDKNQSFD
jgi:all-trans-retinol 13,14-reductase